MTNRISLSRQRAAVSTALKTFRATTARVLHMRDSERSLMVNDLEAAEQSMEWLMENEAEIREWVAAKKTGGA